MNVIKPNFNFKKDFRGDWISNKIDDDGIDYLENFGYYLCDKKNKDSRFPGFNAMTSSQIRNIFGEIKRIELQYVETSENSSSIFDWQTDFRLLRPKIAYNTARVLSSKRENKIKDFRTVVEMAHGQVKNDWGSFKRFSQFVEGIIAYHKVYGGKD